MLFSRSRGTKEPVNIQQYLILPSSLCVSVQSGPQEPTGKTRREAERFRRRLSRRFSAPSKLFKDF